MKQIRKIVQDASGAMIVEFALVFPIVLLLTAGSVDLAMYSYQINAAAKATQLGARWAVVNSPLSTALAADLTKSDWWPDQTLGRSCQDAAVVGGCKPSVGTVYDCTSATCNMTAILAVMRPAYPELTAGEIFVRYQPYSQARSIGFVGRPGGNPVDVVVRIKCKPFQFLFLTGFLNWALPPAPNSCPAGTPPGFYIPASQTTLSSESFGLPVE